MGKETKLKSLTLKIVDSEGTRTIPLAERMEGQVNGKVGTIVIVDLAPEELPEDGIDLGTVMCHHTLKVSLSEGEVSFSNTMGVTKSATCHRFFLSVTEGGRPAPVRIVVS